jgi:uncharacterized protein YbjT (DUF2867 family)
MKAIILVAGATGDLGGRIVKALSVRGATVRAVVRATTDSAKVETLKQAGVDVVRVNNWDVAELKDACKDVACVVSALAGLRDVIVDAQSVLLQAAVAAGVPRFIPSDFSSDYTHLPDGENRNFDLRKEFKAIIDKANIKATTIFNGAFAELLNYNIPFLDFKKHISGYWGSADWRVDFTTMDNTADFTAAAALDETTPRVLQIAGIQINANEMAVIASELLHTPFQAVRMGSLEELSAQNKTARAAHPEGENELYANWQRSQYMHSMFSVQNTSLSNDRYPGIKWTSIRDLLATKKAN